MEYKTPEMIKEFDVLIKNIIIKFSQYENDDIKLNEN